MRKKAVWGGFLHLQKNGTARAQGAATSQSAEGSCQRFVRSRRRCTLPSTDTCSRVKSNKQLAAAISTAELIFQNYSATITLGFFVVAKDAAAGHFCATLLKGTSTRKPANDQLKGVQLTISGALLV
jgi:hypothetical protein